nr:MAG TPA: hypothetical protein [Caudoviricetes sp.]
MFLSLCFSKVYISCFCVIFLGAKKEGHFTVLLVIVSYIVVSIFILLFVTLFLSTPLFFIYSIFTPFYH